MAIEHATTAARHLPSDRTGPATRSADLARPGWPGSLNRRMAACLDTPSTAAMQAQLRPLARAAAPVTATSGSAIRRRNLFSDEQVASFGDPLQKGLGEVELAAQSIGS